MLALRHLVFGIALVSFAGGGVLFAAGDTGRGKRWIAVAIALVFFEPLFEAGLRHLRLLWAGRNRELTDLALVLLLAAVVLAGIVAVGRAGKGGPRATSSKKRVGG
jgi:hypothetical protein